MAEAIKRDNYTFSNNDFYVSVSGNAHRRASVADLKAHYDNGNEKDHPAHWFAAQLIHYGLKPSSTKAVARMRLFDAVREGKLAVPKEMQDAEKEMKKEWMKAQREAKKGEKDAEKTATAGAKRKAADTAEKTADGAKKAKSTATTTRATPAKTTTATAASKAKSTAATASTSKTKTTATAKVTKAAPKSTPAASTPKSGKSLAARKHAPSEPPPGRVTAAFEAATSSPPKRTKQTARKSAPSQPPRGRSPWMKEEARYDDDAMDWKYENDNNDHGLRKYQGVYHVQCPGVSNGWSEYEDMNFSIVFALNGDGTMWGPFDLGIVSGVLKLLSYSHNDGYVRFMWRGVEDAENIIQYGNDNKGWLKFRPNNNGWSVKGYIDYMGFEFTGKWIGHMTDDKSAYNAERKWREKFTERAYEEARVGRWQ